MAVDTSVAAIWSLNLERAIVFQDGSAPLLRLSLEKDLARVEEQRQEAIRVRFERFNTEDVYVVPLESTDGQEMDKPEADEPQG